jgi:hypothetical protein
MSIPHSPTEVRKTPVPDRNHHQLSDHTPSLRHRSRRDRRSPDPIHLIRHRRIRARKLKRTLHGLHQRAHHRAQPRPKLQAQHAHEHRMLRHAALRQRRRCQMPTVRETRTSTHQPQDCESKESYTETCSTACCQLRWDLGKRINSILHQRAHYTKALHAKLTQAS